MNTLFSLKSIKKTNTRYDQQHPLVTPFFTLLYLALCLFKLTCVNYSHKLYMPLGFQRFWALSILPKDERVGEQKGFIPLTFLL